jgi:CubicO group peptidase (beta-lactamase class C family)
MKVSSTHNSPSATSQLQSASAARFFVTDVSGNILVDEGNTAQPIILAGVTKLYTAAMVIREFDRGALSPDTRAAHILPHNMLSGVCVVGGKDYSDDITVAQLLSHRSGVTDYFSFPRRGALSLLRQAEDRDRSWTFSQALELARHYPGRFKPGAPSRVHYSDTNYQILGAILKSTTGLSYAQLLDIRIAGPLGLKKTYAFTQETTGKYYELAPVSWKKTEMHGPESLASFGADGSVVSTAREVVSFLRALWSGKLTDEAWIPKLWSDTTRLGPGLEMGLGAMTFQVKRGVAPYVGHTGFTGSVAFVDPTRRIFGAGSLNRIGYLHKPARTLATLMTKVEP